MRLVVLKLASFEKKKERKKEERKKQFFNFFKLRFLSFYKAELKSKDIFVFRMVRALSIYPFCWI